MGQMQNKDKQWLNMQWHKVMNSISKTNLSSAAAYLRTTQKIKLLCWLIDSHEVPTQFCFATESPRMRFRNLETSPASLSLIWIPTLRASTSIRPIRIRDSWKTRHNTWAYSTTGFIGELHYRSIVCSTCVKIKELTLAFCKWNNITDKRHYDYTHWQYTQTS